MNTDTSPLSLRHERFVAEYLKDGNATQAYIRAGYSPRGAQPSASRLLRDARIEAAVAAGRRRIAEALEVDVIRLAQEYAKIAFANISDFVSVDKDRRLHIDLEKASQAQQAGILEVKIANHRNREQTVTLKLGKLQALAALTKNIGVLVAKPKPGLTAEDRERYEAHCAACERTLDHSNAEQRRLEQELRETRAALESAKGVREPGPADPPEAQPQCAVMPGTPTEPPLDYAPGFHPNAFIIGSGREHRRRPDPADDLVSMHAGAYDPLYVSEEGEETMREIEAWIRAE